jgi:hypothetical protein
MGVGGFLRIVVDTCKDFDGISWFGGEVIEEILFTIAEEVHSVAFVFAEV